MTRLVRLARRIGPFGLLCVAIYVAGWFAIGVHTVLSAAR